jgi:two-component system, OmpR family, sensor histidine kinase VanS
VDEVTETLLPLAAKRGVTIETSGSLAPTVGSHALLLQLAANLVQNAIVHNLPQGGAVWVSTDAHPECVGLTVENTGEDLAPDLVCTLTEPFLRAPHASILTRRASASRSSKASPRPRRNPHPHR